MPSSSSKAPRQPNPENEWWGHCSEHGWVVLDRDWTANTLSLRGPLLLVRCSDWKLFSDSWENWKPPSKTYSFAPRYLEQLDSMRRAASEGELQHLYAEYDQRRGDLSRAAMEARLDQFCERTHNIRTTVRWADSSQYDRPCWKCERRFKSDVDLQCTLCGWFACWDCGACGCAWPGRK